MKDKERLMLNKYQLELQDVIDDLGVSYGTSLLQELVDRATPRKLGDLFSGKKYCIPCYRKGYETTIYEDYNYCPNCGQALDWSE